MNLSFSLLERALIYGPQFIAGLAAVLILACEVFSPGSRAVLRNTIYKAAAGIIFIICAFLFLYTAKDADFIYGISVSKIHVLLLALFTCFFVMIVRPEGGEAGMYILCLAGLASAAAAFLAENSLLVFATFIVMDLSIFAAIMQKKENSAYAETLIPVKIIFVMAAVVFAGLFAFSTGKNMKMAQAGVVIFMMLFSNPGLLSLRDIDAEEGEKFLHKNSSFILFSGIITAVLAAEFMMMTGGQAAARPVIIAAVLLASANIYRTITEEKYQAFAGQDSINPVFLLPALACAANLPAGGIVFPVVLFMLSAFLQNEFISFHDHGRHTVAGLKYGFDKIKPAKLAFFGILSGLAAEACVFMLFYRHLKQDALVFAAVIFLALAFSVSVLNKTFMMFSMLKRFRLNISAAALFNRGNIRPAVFIAFVAAVIMAWLK